MNNHFMELLIGSVKYSESFEMIIHELNFDVYFPIILFN